MEQATSCDPFTGGNAYVSGSGGVQANSFTNGGGVGSDPFTGGNAYTTSNGSNGHSAPIQHDYYPLTKFLSFSTVPKMEALKGKLIEFNAKAPSNLQLGENQINQLINLGQGGEPQLEDIANLIKTLRWPSDLNFPCIDLVRMSLVNPLATDLLLTKHSEELLDLLLQNLSSSNKAANQMLALRSLANLFNSDKGIQLMTDLSETIIQHFSAMFPLENKQAQIAMTTVLLNYAVVYTSRKISKESQNIVMSLCLLFMQGITESEARFRNMVTLGTLLSADAAHLNEAKKLDAKEKVDAVRMLDTSEKVQNCARALLQALS